jgi:hypothetical protein
MKYLLLTRPAQDTMLAGLENMPDFLASAFDGLSETEASTPLSADSFSAVEHCWHLADLEEEGFSYRISRLLEGCSPLLADFDGARIARDRNYRTRSLAQGIAAFRSARQKNLALLRNLSGDDWNQKGEQEGVGPVMLCDIPVMMAEHDASHRDEIAGWLHTRKDYS